eukprot:CFRG5528T1
MDSATRGAKRTTHHYHHYVGDWDRGYRNGRANNETSRLHRREEAATFLSTISMCAEPGRTLPKNTDDVHLLLAGDEENHRDTNGVVMMPEGGSNTSRSQLRVKYPDTDEVKEGLLLEQGVIHNTGTNYVASRGGLRGIQKPMVLVSPHSRCPFYMFTVIRYDQSEKYNNPGYTTYDAPTNLHRQPSTDISTRSYMHLLQSSWPQTADAWEALKKSTYVIDDPALRSGKHRTVLSLPSMKVSVIQYAKPSDLKRDLNEQFRERHPDFQITLSKMRSLKRVVSDIILDNTGLELAIAALSHLYFEQLIEKGAVNKTNRKIMAGCTLLLAFKFYSARSDREMKHLIEAIGEDLGVSKRELINNEFSVFVTLDFALHQPLPLAMSYFQNLVQIFDYSELLFDPYGGDTNPASHSHGLRGQSTWEPNQLSALDM